MKNGSNFNKRKKRDPDSSRKIQGNHCRAEIRKVNTGINVSVEGGDVAGKQSLVYLSDLSASSSYSLADVEVNYEESDRMENQRDGSILYEVRMYGCA